MISRGDARCGIAGFKVLHPLLYRVARAIEAFEGNLENNPGNLRKSSLARGGTTEFAVFDHYHIGFLALLFDLKAKAQGRTVTKLGPNSTITDLMHAYAPPSENNTENYIRFIQVRTDLDPSTRLGDLL